MLIFRVYKNIECGDELLVWYGDEYAEELGIENEEEEEKNREEMLKKSKYFWVQSSNMVILWLTCD